MIISHSKTIKVNNLIERDNLNLKKPGMRVEVLDSSADNQTDGSAIYEWTGTDWIIVSQEVDRTKLISNDQSLDTMQEMVDYVKDLQNQLDDLVPKIYIQNVDPSTQETVQENSIWIQIP